MSDEKRPLPEVRIDKWLQVARIYKTRSQATDAIQAGHVKMDGRRAKASQILKIGDVIQVTKGARKLELTVKALAAKPIAKELARELYTAKEEIENREGLSEEQREIVKRMQQMDRLQEAARRGQGRPTKKARRDIGKNRGR